MWLVLLLLMAVPADAQIPRGTLYTALEATHISLQAADTTTTLIALNRGLAEANPVLQLPPAGIVAVKAGVTVSTVLLSRKLARRQRVLAVVLLAGLNTVSAVVVARNLSVMRSR
jgi:hypothetical protein